MYLITLNITYLEWRDYQNGNEILRLGSSNFFRKRLGPTIILEGCGEKCFR